MLPILMFDPPKNGMHAQPDNIFEIITGKCGIKNGYLSANAVNR